MRVDGILAPKNRKCPRTHYIQNINKMLPCVLRVSTFFFAISFLFFYRHIALVHLRSLVRFTFDCSWAWHECWSLLWTVVSCVRLIFFFFTRESLSVFHTCFWWCCCCRYYSNITITSLFILDHVYISSDSKMHRILIELWIKCYFACVLHFVCVCVDVLKYAKASLLIYI